MQAIVTLTFNPALDKSTVVQALIPDRKLKCSEPVCLPGGGGINVARAITILGENPTAVFFAGGFAGAEIENLLTQEGVKTLPVPIGGATRENLVIFDQSKQQQYLLDMPGPNITKAEWEMCLNQIESFSHLTYLVVSGSTPAGIPETAFTQLAHIANKKNARLIVDTSGAALLQAVNAGVYMIKPNLRELGFLAGIENITIQNAGDAAREIIKKGHCEVIIVSAGAGGVILVTQTQTIPITPPPVTVKSTVGAGDSLVAGIIIALSQNKDLLNAVQYGVACGTAATLNAGTELCRKADAEDLFKKIQNKNNRNNSNASRSAPLPAGN
ncbi:MAG: 1-phosphofructokinase family hexose kinase [Mucilaginibacter sp.]